jgi:hypoxia-inducible factor (prolyl hydroxylase)
MCGGHEEGMAPEGEMSRIIKNNNGEIQPCKLQAKAAAPIKSFNAMMELISSVDKLVDSLKPCIPDLNGIYERSDVMLAVYPGNGSRFARHIDNTTGDGRRLTVLVYLNPKWEESQGGALRISTSSSLRAVTGANAYVDNEAIDIYPFAGRVVILYSSEIAHEVRPVLGNDRHAITIWYYDKEERANAVKQANLKGRATQVSRTTIAHQLEAKTFISQLMGGDDISSDGGEPTAAELQMLGERVVLLSEEALRIVVSITGAESPATFRLGFQTLTTSDLKAMRALFRKMGLH